MKDCVKWPGYIGHLGYGKRWFRGKAMNAHRAAWIEKHGDVAKGIDIDHMCHNRACVNLDHLRAVTHYENLMNGNTIAARNVQKRACNHGHPFNVENTYVNPQGHRECRTCRKAFRKPNQEPKTMKSKTKEVTQFTPGPWRVDHNRYDNEWRVYTDEKNGGVPVINSLFRGKDAEADARLISACPTMLDALQDAYDLFASKESLSADAVEVWNKIDLAIKKAVGEDK